MGRSPHKGMSVLTRKHGFAVVLGLFALAVLAWFTLGSSLKPTAGVGDEVRRGDVVIRCEGANYYLVRREDGSPIGDDMRLVVKFTITNVGELPLAVVPNFQATTLRGSSLDVEPDSAEAAGDNSEDEIQPGGSVTALAVVSAFLESTETIRVGGEFAVVSAESQVIESAWFAVPLAVTREPRF